MGRLFDPDLVDRQSADREFHLCSLKGMPETSSWTAAGLFAGIGGIELGLERAGIATELLCEWWDPARAVLEHHFPDVPLEPDIRDLRLLPPVDLVAAGFPCTDLSQAGKMKGITGEASGLVGEVFRLLRDRRVPWVLLENVRNMLVLDGGQAMRFLIAELESLGYRWAYRLVDSRFTGVPQRRQRVIFVATTDGDPREVLFADDVGEPSDSEFADDAFGFYWTEGLRGLGWARDAVPTLKGGSTIGIPSPPAIWSPSSGSGLRLVTPSVVDAEQMQGFDPDWTAPADKVSDRKGTRWKLVGNAVTVGVSSWVARRLAAPGVVNADVRQLDVDAAWPRAGFGANGKRWSVDVSMWPVRDEYTHLSDLVDLDAAQPLSLRAAAGFLDRATRGTLRIDERFLDDVASHLDALAAA
jgi:DNA (cytosine-5)-methyltransferase 1